MAKEMTLTDAIGYLRAKGIKVSFGHFEDFDAFKSYYEYHYRDALKRVRGESLCPDRDLRLIGFLREDLDDILES